MAELAKLYNEIVTLAGKRSSVLKSSTVNHLAISMLALNFRILPKTVFSDMGGSIIFDHVQAKSEP